MVSSDSDLDVRADAVGRRGEVGRRGFVRSGVSGAAMSSALVMQGDRSAGAASMAGRTTTVTPRGLGLVKAGPELALPPGFKYHTFGAFGSAMSDGFITPPIHDGMAVFGMENGRLRIVRNHELGEGNDIPAGTVIGDPKTAYDRKAPGGTVTLEVDAEKRRAHLGLGQPERHRHQLRGHIRRLGGPGSRARRPRSARESGVQEGHTATCSRSTRRTTRAVPTQPYKKLGRFLHEAGAIDPSTGVVYLTEDEGPDGFYRFVPDRRGHLRDGVLQMLRVRGKAKYNTISGQKVGVVLSCDWVTIDDPNPENAEDDASAVFKQGRAKGGAKFLGGEGCTLREGSVVFGSSEGGDAGRGQVWQYTPKTSIGRLGEHGNLVLLFESKNGGELDGPDNMCTSPGGAIVIAEDGNVHSNFVRRIAAEQEAGQRRREPRRRPEALHRGFRQALRSDGP